MSHGFMGLRLSGFIYLAAATGFIGYLGTAYTGPVGPKFQLHPLALEVIKETQPGIEPNFYLKKD